MLWLLHAQLSCLHMIQKETCIIYTKIPTQCHHFISSYPDNRRRPKSRQSKIGSPHFAMTSTYLPPLPFFLAAPFLGAGTPNKSSMLLAFDILVCGRLGGPPRLGVPGAVPETLAPPAAAGGAGLAVREAGFEGPPMGGGMLVLRSPIPGFGDAPADAEPPIGSIGGVGAPFGGPPPRFMALAALRKPAPGGPARGGGGVAVGLAAWSAGSAFLLTHFLRSVS